MSAPRLTAVAGVLLLSPGDPPPAITSSLLLAWLAARKAAPQGVTLAALVAPLAKIGWSLGSQDDPTQSVELAGFRDNLWRAALGEGADELLGALASPSPGRRRVLDAWWARLQAVAARLSPSLPVARLSTEGAAISLRLAAPVPGLATDSSVVLEQGARLAVATPSATLTLSPQVLASVEADIAAKVAPHADLVVRE